MLFRKEVHESTSALLPPVGQNVVCKSARNDLLSRLIWTLKFGRCCHRVKEFRRVLTHLTITIGHVKTLFWNNLKSLQRQDVHQGGNMVRREKSNYVIQSVSHALDVVEQFNGNVDEIGVTELSKRLKLHKNNVFRLLATLEARGYIEQNKITENYRLGIRCLQLGQTYVNQMGLLRQARPILEEVSRQSRENTYVA